MVVQGSYPVNTIALPLPLLDPTLIASIKSHTIITKICNILLMALRLKQPSQDFQSLFQRSELGSTTTIGHHYTHILYIYTITENCIDKKMEEDDGSAVGEEVLVHT